MHKKVAIPLKNSFAESLKKLRTDSNLSQQQLADKLFVNRSTITNWELGRRVPDATTIIRLAEILHVDVSELLGTGDQTEKINIIMADDEKIILRGGLPILKKFLPDANVKGFTSPSEVLSYAKNNRIDIALLDIEMGRVSGFDLCNKLLEINPILNVIFLTAYMDYAFDAWSTKACGFLVKPLTTEKLKKTLSCLRYPIRGLKIS